jgi:hypothetical protein
MVENRRDSIGTLPCDAKERLQVEPLPPVERPTIHYSELPTDTSDSPIAGEWNFYRREVGRLLAEGYEGRWVLIQGQQILGIWDTEEEAERIRLQKFLGQPLLLKQIRVREAVLRGGGYDRVRSGSLAG